jgi:hypothetical protein
VSYKRKRRMKVERIKMRKLNTFLELLNTHQFELGHSNPVQRRLRCTFKGHTYPSKLMETQTKGQALLKEIFELVTHATPRPASYILRTSLARARPHETKTHQHPQAQLATIKSLLSLPQ